MPRLAGQQERPGTEGRGSVLSPAPGRSTLTGDLTGDLGSSRGSGRGDKLRSQLQSQGAWICKFLGSSMPSFSTVNWDITRGYLRLLLWGLR